MAASASCRARSRSARASPPVAGALAVADVLVPSLGSDAGSGARVARDRLVATLDSTAGLERVTQGASGTLWRTQTVDETAPAAVTAWARLETADATGATPVASSRLGIDTTIAAGDDERLLVLAERADPHWHATLDGRGLRSVDDGWRQAFQVGASGGNLVVTYDAPQKTPWIVLQGLVLLVTILLAAPVRRRRTGRA